MIIWTIWCRIPLKTDDTIAHAAIYQRSHKLFILSSVSGLATQYNILSLHVAIVKHLVIHLENTSIYIMLHVYCHYSVEGSELLDSIKS
jgi:hypothetical protein